MMINIMWALCLQLQVALWVVDVVVLCCHGLGCGVVVMVVVAGGVVGCHHHHSVVWSLQKVTMKMKAKRSLFAKWGV